MPPKTNDVYLNAATQQSTCHLLRLQRDFLEKIHQEKIDYFYTHESLNFLKKRKSAKMNQNDEDGDN